MFFAFFSILYKRINVFRILFHSLEKNRTFFAFFSVLYKITERSLNSCTFFIKECGILFGFISRTKIVNLVKKRTKCSAFFCKKMKRSRILLLSLQKNVACFAFFYVLCKRMLHSLRYFPFFRKD